MRTLLVSLSEHPIAMLRGIAELRGVVLASNARDGAAAQLAAALGDEQATDAALAELFPAARAAWDALLRAGGKMKAATFARQFGEISPIGPGRLERDALWRQPQNASEELWYRGLVFRTFADFGDGPMEYIYIPEDLPITSLEATPAARDQAGAIAAVPAPPRSRHALNSLAVDACSVLAALRMNALGVDAASTAASITLTPEGAAALSGSLLLPDPVRLDMLLALAQGEGWLAEHRGRLVTDTARSSAWLRLTHWEQMSLLLSLWRDSTMWNDLRHVPGLRAEGEWQNDPAAARGRVLKRLRELDARAWYRVDDLVALMKQVDPDFQRPDGVYTGWYLREEGSTHYLSGFESWDAVEGRLLRFLVRGPLFWLGAVALGEEGGPAAGGAAASGAATGGADGGAGVFRLTPVGAAWLGRRTPPNLPRPARLSVDDAFEVTAPLLLPLFDRYRLLQITDAGRAGGAASAVERWEARREMLTPAATRHRITRASLARARAAGIKGESALAFLKRAAGGRVPPKVVAAMQRYDQLGGRVRITRGAVLRVSDANVLSALRSDPLIAPLLGELLSAQAVIVPEDRLERLVAILRDSNYTVEG